MSADHSVQVNYNSDNTKKYGGTSCSGTSDCQSNVPQMAGARGIIDNGFSTVKAWGKSANGGTDPGVINNINSIF